MQQGSVGAMLTMTAHATATPAARGRQRASCAGASSPGAMTSNHVALTRRVFASPISRAARSGNGNTGGPTMAVRRGVIGILLGLVLLVIAGSVLMALAARGGTPTPPAAQPDRPQRHEAGQVPAADADPAPGRAAEAIGG
ncbi:MAG: hypothetical protein KY442_06260 [Proteobacteria bacterium]|nr:hypothetical protein [Pseudomonadota bacterium]